MCLQILYIWYICLKRIWHWITHKGWYAIKPYQTQTYTRYGLIPILKLTSAFLFEQIELTIQAITSLPAEGKAIIYAMATE